jgi:hypothetical protein
MNQPTLLSILAAGLLTAASTTASAQQPSALEPPGSATPGQVGGAGDIRALYADVLNDEELRRFAQMRQQARTRAELDRIEAEESALLNVKVAQRITALQRQPQQPTAPSTAERPLAAPDRMPPQSPSDRDAGEGSMGR